MYDSGENRLHSLLSPSRPPNNTLDTRQQRTQVHGHLILLSEPEALHVDCRRRSSFARAGRTGC